MELRTERCDVLVVGSGIAGITAALRAAEEGADVMMVTRGRVGSGSSFWGATWGLGLVGPYDETEASIEDFVDEICEVGQGFADRDLVEKLVRGIGPALDWIRSKGFVVREPSDEAKDDREYVPCFDRKVRGWHGLGTHESVEAMREAVSEAGVRTLEQATLVDLYKDADGAVCGALVECDGAAIRIESNAVILATGGMSALFDGHLSADDSDGSATTLALLAGAKLLNVQFLQQMVAYETETGPLVFNEKLWRNTKVEDAVTGEDAFAEAGFDDSLEREALEAHSWHGPFTSSRVSKYVETAIARTLEHGGATARVDIDLDSAPEFVKVYANWLRDVHGIDLRIPHPVYIAMQASNGGVLVDAEGRTGVDGLYAAGEATGGYHGADRIGGLASATALVSGLAAGENAAAWAAGSFDHRDAALVLPLNWNPDYISQVDLERMRHEVTIALVGSRGEKQLEHAGKELLEGIRAYGGETFAAGTFGIAADNALAYQRMLSALSIIVASLDLKTSVGSHARIADAGGMDGLGQPRAWTAQSVLDYL
jgi:L-aspartate oxidase